MGIKPTGSADRLNGFFTLALQGFNYTDSAMSFAECSVQQERVLEDG